MKKVRGRVVQRQPGNQQEQESTQTHPFSQISTTATIQTAQLVYQNTQEQGQREVVRETHGKRTEIFNNSAGEKRQTISHTPNAAKSTVESAFVCLKFHGKKEEQSIQSTSIQPPSEGKAGQAKNSEEERKNRIEQLKNKYLKKNAEVKIEPIKVVQTAKEVSQQPPKSVIVPPPLRFQKEEKVEIIIQAEIQEVVQPIKGPREERVENIEPKKEVIQKKQEIKPQTQQPTQTIQVSVKLEEKRQGKVPPPPPIGRNHPKNKLLPGPTPKEVEQQKEELKEDVTEPIEQKQQETSPQKLPQQAPIKNVFSAPPPRNKAPPPRSIISPVIPTKQTRKVQEVIPTSQPPLPPKPLIKSQPFANPLAPEPKQHPNQSSISLSLQQQINLWISSPSSLLSSLPGINELLQGSSFTFTSSNPHFNSTLATFISEFVLKSKGELSTEQKLALYNFSLEYFQSSTGGLSSELLLILAKLGSSYLSKYSVENIKKYTKDLMTAKSHFSNEELNALIGFLLDQKQVNNTQLLHLLLIFPNERLVSILCSKNFSQSSEILPFLAVIQLQKKDFTLLLPVYLKLIGTLVENIPRDQSVIEKILKHVSELQMNERCYQLHKQLKLKLISILSKDEAPQRQETRPIKVETKEDKSDGGLRGYWNKAVDTLKTATTQLVDLKQSVNPPKQEKQEEEELTYDPVLKRWLINGKVPDDQSEKPSDSTAPKAPPPPPPKAGNKPTPPPLPSKKGRVATNRYA